MGSGATADAFSAYSVIGQKTLLVERKMWLWCSVNHWYTKKFVAVQSWGATTATAPPPGYATGDWHHSGKSVMIAMPGTSVLTPWRCHVIRVHHLSAPCWWSAAAAATIALCLQWRNLVGARGELMSPPSGRSVNDKTSKTETGYRAGNNGESKTNGVWFDRSHVVRSLKTCTEPGRAAVV